ncbi:kelch motif family protein [Stylonychia lemnae]|uniref:Kelch motif family protein n=1 Tax=Stylonychia lemnae TaxID=5949 RepID=A0A077ZZ57_STYLE|nr:kelch motif family protein [Stylonychia lemnae]|eukprot:CDW74857.1 kelch motif family protein [Stylonychia lemnae]
MNEYEGKCSGCSMSFNRVNQFPYVLANCNHLVCGECANKFKEKGMCSLCLNQQIKQSSNIILQQNAIIEQPVHNYQSHKNHHVQQARLNRFQTQPTNHTTTSIQNNGNIGTVDFTSQMIHQTPSNNKVLSRLSKRQDSTSTVIGPVNLMQQNNQPSNNTTVQMNYPQSTEEIPTPPEQITSETSYLCIKHPDKYVEYFCRDCHITVCIRCMFHEHNGHFLSQLEEAHTYLKQTIQDFENLLMMTKKINKQNTQLLIQLKEEVDKLKDTQVQNINRAFTEIVKRLEAKRDAVKMQYNHLYEREQGKLEDKLRPLQKYEENLVKVESIYKDIKGIIQSKNQIQLLSQMKDVNSLKIDPYGNLHSDEIRAAQNKPPLNTNNYQSQQSLNATQNKFHQLNTQKEYEMNNELGHINQSPNRNYSSTHNHDLAQNLRQANQILNEEFKNKEGPRVHSMDRNQLSSTIIEDSMDINQTLNIHPRPQTQFIRPYLAQREISPAKINNLSVIPQNIRIPSPLMSARANEYEEVKRANSHRRHQQESSSQLPVYRNYRPHVIHCFGDYEKLLRYDFQKNIWSAISYNHQSAFKGDFKYTSSCRIAKTCDIILSGGCSVMSQKASNKAFKINTEDGAYKFIRMQNLMEARYGHSQLYLNGYIYAIGGFSHDDNPGVAPITLQSCEKYTPADNTWSYCAELIMPRAYAGCCPFNNESIYIFGGLNGYETTNTIEQYNTMLDKWSLLYVKLPLKIAKLGAVALDRNSILIAGGIFGDTEMSYQYVNSVYRLDTSTTQAKWVKQNKMIGKRTLYSTLPMLHTPIGQQIYALGGTIGDQCEVFELKNNKWSSISSYKDILPQNDLQTFSLCF